MPARYVCSDGGRIPSLLKDASLYEPDIYGLHGEMIGDIGVGHKNQSLGKIIIKQFTCTNLCLLS